MKVIAIAGCSGSGKSVLSRALAQRLDAPVIALDSYYFPQREVSLEERARTNYDHPDSIEWSLLVSHLETLRSGASVAIPTYDFARRRVAPGSTLRASDCRRHPCAASSIVAGRERRASLR
jgi:uridine kinase